MAAGFVDSPSDNINTVENTPCCLSLHHQTFIKRMDDLRKRGLFCDVILQVGICEIHAHKNVLAANSIYFEGLFGSRMKEDETSRVILEKTVVDQSVIEDIVTYIYTGEIQLTSNKVKQVIIAADYLLLETLKDVSCSFLESNLDLAEYFEIRDFAEKYNCRDLKRKVEGYLYKNFLRFSQSQEFLDLRVDQIEELLCREDLAIEREEQVYEAMLRWIENDRTGRRRDHFPRLFQLIRIPAMSKYYIADHVEQESMVKSNIQCLQWLCEAKNYLLIPERQTETYSDCRYLPRQSMDSITEAIYICGEGRDGNIHGIFLPESSEFIEMQQPNYCRQYHATLFCNKAIYICGGMGHQGDDPAEPSPSVEKFDMLTNNWYSAKAMRKPDGIVDEEVTGVVLEGLIYVVTGTDYGRRTHSSVQRYNPGTDTWELVTSMNVERVGSCAVALFDCVYILGGRSDGITMNSVEKYVPEEEMWLNVQPMIYERYCANALMYNNKIYVCGGLREDGTALNKCEVYSHRDDMWDVIANLRVPRSNFGLACVGDKFYAVGGLDEDEDELSSIEVYDSQAGTWTVICCMEEKVEGLSCCSVTLSQKYIRSLSKVRLH